MLVDALGVTDGAGIVFAGDTLLPALAVPDELGSAVATPAAIPSDTGGE